MLETKRIVNDAGYFDVNIPLKLFLGFAEKYRKIIINCKHELVLTRANSDDGAVHQRGTAEGVTVKLKNIEWLMLHVQLLTDYKIRMLRLLERQKSIKIAFRSWELYEYPALPSTTSHIWHVKTSNQLEKPRFAIMGFPTNRNKLIMAKKTSLLKTKSMSYMPLIVIDCSKQNETLKNALVDVKVNAIERKSLQTPQPIALYYMIVLWNTIPLLKTLGLLSRDIQSIYILIRLNDQLCCGNGCSWLSAVYEDPHMSKTHTHEYTSNTIGRAHACYQTQCRTTYNSLL